MTIQEVKDRGWTENNKKRFDGKAVVPRCSGTRKLALEAGPYVDAALQFHTPLAISSAPSSLVHQDGHKLAHTHTHTDTYRRFF